MTDLVVFQKALSVDGQNLFLDLVAMGADQGLLVNQAAEALGVAPRTVQEHLKNHSITCTEIPRESLKKMKIQGLIKPNAPRAFFIPRESIRALAKVVNTKRAWAVYEQLWAVTDRAYAYHKKQQSEQPNAIDFLLGTLKALENQIHVISKLQSKMETMNESIDVKIEHALGRDKDFPADCMKIDEIRKEFFPGLATSAVRRYLSNINHPRGSFRITTDDGRTAVSRPFKRRGLERAAERLFDESILDGMTERNNIYLHPDLGKYFQNRSAAPGKNIRHRLTLVE